MGTDCDCQHARYARTQFTDPNLGQAESAEMLVKMRENSMRTGMIMMKRILLRKQQSPCTRWILTNAYTVAKYQDRNASVVMATAQVYCSRHRRLSTRTSSSRWPSCWTRWRSLVPRLPLSGWWRSTVRCPKMS